MVVRYANLNMTYLIGKLQEQLGKEENGREKKSFWASEAETPLFDLYHKWLGTKPTNPIEPEKQIIFSAGKMMELALVENLVKMGEAKKIEGQEYISMEREGVKVTGLIDCLLTDGSPLEIKTYYGNHQTEELKAGKPKISYLKQLAIYMDFLGKDLGKLFYMERGTGEMFEFLLERNGTKFKCLDIEFDLTETYKRWAKLYNENIVPKVEPKSEYRYKIPVKEIDWKTISKTDISKARNNQKVIGDHPWAIQYSAYKDLIIQKEGTTPGYTEDEVKIILDLTKGYTAWK